MSAVITRRDALMLLAGGPIAGLAGCESIPLPVPRPITGRLADVHSHVFNATDLPAARFIRYAFLHDYPEQGRVGVRAIEDPDFLDALLSLFVRIVTGAAPKARDEIEVLEGRRPASIWALDKTGAEQLAAERTAEYLTEPRARVERQARADDKLRVAILEASGRGLAPGRISPLLRTEASSAARAAITSQTEIGAYLRWFALFSRYRHSLVDQLVSDHQRQGYAVEFLSPATIDFSRWLGESVDSPLRDQVEVMSLISIRRGGPPIHGYIAFDPLRQVYFRHFRREEDNALGIVRDALSRHGFIGVKLYPPMGFRPFGNDGTLRFPKRVTSVVGPTLANDLNRALAELYDLCVELDAPILAHAAESNGPGPDYARRADPVFWLPVFQKWPRLRVGLAHFGRFASRSGARRRAIPPLEDTWEWTIGRHLRRHPNASVYVDLSYFSEALTADSIERTRLATALRKFLAEFDPEARHILFGTDWVMIGREANHAFYTIAVVDFLRRDCGLDESRVQRILSENAVDFLGLRGRSYARERLLGFYRRHDLPEARFLRIAEVA